MFLRNGLLRLARSFSVSHGVACMKRQGSHHLVAASSVEEPKDNLTYRFICDKIRSGGPITIYEFMQICAGGSAGYYSQKTHIFGASGDFVTAPELSQMFGEAIAVWITAELQSSSHIGPWQLVEFGAGTGSLMHDILRSLNAFKLRDFSVHIIETSEALMLRQRKVLRVRSKTSKGREKKAYNAEAKRSSSSVGGDPMVEYAFNGLPIFWHQSVDDVPEKFTVFIANEFLDALPIHQFQRVPSVSRSDGVGRVNNSDDWREVYVNLNDENRLCTMLSRSENVHTRGLIPDYIRDDSTRSQWEVCPNAADVLGRVVYRFTSHGGFALFVDYGHDGERKTHSLRAYRKHKLVNFLEPEAAGRIDLTADVDFGHLRRALEGSCLIFGPTQQQSFLMELGVLHRLRVLMAKCETDKERDYLHKSFKMLMGSTNSGDQSGMGTAFKAFALFPNTLVHIMEKRGGAPIGFQNQVIRK